MRNYARHFVIVAVLIVVASFLVYALLTAIYQLPTAASAEADTIAPLFDAHFIMISVLFSLVMVFMGYSIVVFRQRPGEEEEDGDHFHGNTTLEIAWTIFPLLAVIVFGIWGARMLSELVTPSGDEMVVHVEGQQWIWTFEYPEQNNVRSDVMVLPVDQPIRLEMESLDVLHSFWVPEFRLKQDLLPGQTTRLLITPTEEGEYKVRCAEICGTLHATMLADVRVVSQSEFDSWVQEQSSLALPETAEERGEMWYTEFGCNACHSLGEETVVGPGWQGLFGSERTLVGGETRTADEAYLEFAILHPHDEIVEGFSEAMPSNFEERFAEAEARYDTEVDIVAELIAFIKTLSERE